MPKYSGNDIFEMAMGAYQKAQSVGRKLVNKVNRMNVEQRENTTMKELLKELDIDKDYIDLKDDSISVQKWAMDRYYHNEMMKSVREFIFECMEKVTGTEPSEEEKYRVNSIVNFVELDRERIRWVREMERMRGRRV